MRTAEQFQRVWETLQWWHSFHKKPVWLIALPESYVLSIIKPAPAELAFGTVANLYDVDGTILDYVSSKE